MDAIPDRIYFKDRLSRIVRNNVAHGLNLLEAAVAPLRVEAARLTGLDFVEIDTTTHAIVALLESPVSATCLAIT